MTNTNNTMNTLLEAWDLLGLVPGNTNRTIRQKYLRLAKGTHPNKGGNNEGFKRLQRLYNAATKAYRNKRFNAVAAAASRRRTMGRFRSAGPTLSVRPGVAVVQPSPRRRHKPKPSHTNNWAKANLSGPWSKPAIKKKKTPSRDVVLLLPPRRKPGTYGLTPNMLRELGIRR